MTKTIRQLVCMIGVALIATACAFDDSEWNAQPEKRKAVRFSLSVPGVATPSPSTRSLTNAQEEAINTVDVLVFYTEGTHAGTLSSHEQGTRVADNTYEIELPEGTYDLVILGNATSIIGSATFIPETTAKTAALASLIHTNTSYWATPSIPLWGYVNNVAIEEDTSLTGANAIDLHRMLSKIEVQLSTAAAGVNNANFELTSVRLYNYNTKGRLAPDMSNWNPTGGVVNVGKGIATAPTIPADRGAVTGVNNPLLFNASQGLTANNLLNTIYTFEATNGTAESLATNPCLVIGGRYQGDSETFYRVDFIKSVEDEEDVYLHLLRNHRYLFNINSVTGSGEEDPDDAFNSQGSSNIEVNVLQWEEGEIIGFAFDGQNYLGVSQDVFAFTSDPRAQGSTDNKLKIRTDVSAGWTATVWGDLAGTQPVSNDGTTGNPWLRISPTSGTGADDTDNVMTLSTDRNESGIDRTAYVHITAGRLIYVVKVTQSIPTLKIKDFATGEEITSIFFSSSASQLGIAPYFRQVLVEWSPASEDVTVTRTPGLTWNSACPPILRNGSCVLTIDPPGITQNEVDNVPFINKSTQLTFTLGSTANTKTLDIEQQHYALYATNFKNATATTLSQTGLVKSNAPWSVSWTSALSTGSMTSPTTQPITGVANTSGTTFPYSFANNSEGAVTFTFTPTDPEKAFDPVTVTVNAVQLPSVDPGTITGAGNVSLTTFVGAFWRATQRGERLIHLKTAATNWAVQVLDYGDDFQPGDIVFEAGESADRDADAETQLLTSTDPYAVGTATATSGIKFRIGLTTQWNASNPNYDGSRPVRYARVVVSYGSNYASNRVIYIRQGEAPDYVIHPTDRTTRSQYVKRFSPYNLTAPAYRDGSASEAEEYINLSHRGGEFVEYPSQAGGYYKFASSTYIYNPAPVTYSWWHLPAMDTSIKWAEDLAPTGEICPQGYSDGNNYRRATGFTKVGAVASTAEFYASLSYNDFNYNLIFGFYADGYFDRREIENPAGGYQPANGTVVNKNSYNIAYYGALIYNNIAGSERENASIFFPYAGYRSETDGGGMCHAGRQPYYWTSTPVYGGSNTSIWGDLWSYAGGASQYSTSRARGLSIRCVVDE